MFSATRYNFNRTEVTGVDIDLKLIDFRNKNELVIPGNVDIGLTSDYGDHKLSRLDQTLLKWGWVFPINSSFIVSIFASIGSSTDYPIYETLTTPNPVILNGEEEIYPTRTAYVFKNRRRETDLFKYVDVTSYFEFSLKQPKTLTLGLFVNWVSEFKVQLIYTILSTRVPRVKLDCKIKTIKEEENQELELELGIEVVEDLTILELDSD